MMMTSRYTMQLLPLRSPRTSSIRDLNVTRVFFNPKGMIVNWTRPADVMKAVLTLLSSSTVTCQYPLLKVRLEKTEAPTSDSRSSEMLGRGFASVCHSSEPSVVYIETVSPSQLGTMTTGDMQPKERGLHNGLHKRAPSSISFRCCSTIECFKVDILKAFCFIGTSVVVGVVLF